MNNELTLPCKSSQAASRAKALDAEIERRAALLTSPINAFIRLIEEADKAHLDAGTPKDVLCLLRAWSVPGFQPHIARLARLLSPEIV